MEIRYYNRNIEEFADNLDKSTRAKCFRTLKLLEKFGKNLNMPYSKKIEDNLFELRTKGQKEIRIIYCFQKDSVYLLNIFIKKSNKIPKKELRLAKKRLKSLDIT